MPTLSHISIILGPTSSQMSIDTHIPRRPAKRLAFPIRDMLLRLRVPVLLRHPEVHNMHQICVLCPRPADEEVVRLDIPVDEVLVMDGLHARYLGRIAHTMI